MDNENHRKIQTFTRQHVSLSTNVGSRSDEFKDKGIRVAG